MPVFLTVEDVMKALRRGDDTIYRWLQEGRFPNARKLNDGGWLIPEPDVVAFLAQQPKATDLLSVPSKSKSRSK